jgi:hypothetical protein
MSRIRLLWARQSEPVKKSAIAANILAATVLVCFECGFPGLTSEDVTVSPSSFHAE